ncbi:MAG: DUF362 domain-containing protein [bacterium]|nr:DUF362 domain-containing protein [bacterium]
MTHGNRTRRKFIRELVGLCVAGPPALKAFAETGSVEQVLSPIRKRLPNPFVENGKPIVLVVKGTDFPTMLARGMDLLGGFARFGTNKSVIVKPNFVFDKKTRYPTTTHEDSVLTTVQYLQKEGFSNITVADRRGKRKNGRAGGKFDWSGLNDLAEEGGFATDSLMDEGEAPTVHVGDPRWTAMPSIGVIKKIYEAGLIINMPTLKKHSQTNLTCSLKNNMGFLDVPTTMDMHLWGDSNKATHDSMPADEVTRRLSLAVAECALAVSPELTVIDAREVLCKNHGSYRTGEPREANRLIISGDPVAADVYSAQVLKEVYEPYELGPTSHTFEHAARLGIGVMDPGEMRVKIIEA